MAKTVFGMPGAENKASGADTPAQPGSEVKTVGGQSDGELKQRPGAAATKPSPAGTIATRPAMSKSHNVPMAKPSFAKPSEEKRATAAGKTVFGMPALKLPVEPQTPAQVTPDLAATQAVPAVRPRLSGAGLPGPRKDGMEFKKTVLGMAAVPQEEPSRKSSPSNAEALVAPAAAVRQPPDETAADTLADAAALETPPETPPETSPEAAPPKDTAAEAVAPESPPALEIPPSAAADPVEQKGLSKSLMILVILAAGLTIIYFAISSILPTLLYTSKMQDVTQTIQDTRAPQAPGIPTPPAVPPSAVPPAPQAPSMPAPSAPAGQ